MIFKFIETVEPLKGPGREIFKIARLSKKMHELVKLIYKEKDFSIFAENQAKEDLVNVLRQEYNLIKYQHTPRFLKNLIYAWRSPVFGGNVFTPIYGSQTGIGGLKEKRADGRKIEKGNNLMNEIA